MKASRSSSHPSSRSRASRFSSSTIPFSSPPPAMDGDEEDFADSLVYFAYSPYNNNDNDNNDDNNIAREIRISSVNWAFTRFGGST